MFEAESGIRLVSHATKAVTTAAKASAMMKAHGELDEIALEDEVLETGHELLLRRPCPRAGQGDATTAR